MFLWGGAAEGYDRLWTIHLIEGYSLPAIAGVGLVGWFGIIRAGGMVLSILGAGLARRRIDTDSDNALARSMLGLALLIGLALAGLAFAPSFLVGALAVWVVAGARNVLHPLITTWVNRHSEEAVRATVLSGVRQAASFGELSVGPGLGWIARVMSVTAALAGSSMLIGTSLVGWARLTIPRKEKV
jgi:DHA3 family tetracycline resistance protein-like MFS transporter